MKPLFDLKQEAAALLALETLTREQEIRLNILTAQAAGYQRLKVGESRNMSGDQWDTYILVGTDGEPVTPRYENKHYKAEDVWLMESPEFATSIDACMKLPLHYEFWWDIKYPVHRDPDNPNSERGYAMAAIYHPDTPIGYSVGEAIMSSVPLAMLGAWWEMRVH